MRRLTSGLAAVFALFVLGTFGSVPNARAAGADSVFMNMSADVIVPGTATVVLNENTVAGGQTVFVAADGRYYPGQGLVLADIYLTVDGVKVSNDSLIDWRTTPVPAQHTFNAIAALTLSAGVHNISMMAAGSGPFTVGAGSALMVMTKPATTVLQASLQADTAILHVTGGPGSAKDGYAQPSWVVLTQNIVSDGTPIVALGSENAFYQGIAPNNYGDALAFIAADGPLTCAMPTSSGICACGTSTSTPSSQCSWTTSWADNDIYSLAETQAPLFVHGFFTAPAGAHQISLNAGMQGGGGDNVEYSVGSGSSLVVMNGGMTVAGSAIAGVKSGYVTGCPTACNLLYRLIATTPYNFPPVGNSVVLDKASFTIPAGHNGVVFFSGKSELQGDSHDQGGNAELYLSIGLRASGQCRARRNGRGMSHQRFRRRPAAHIPRRREHPDAVGELSVGRLEQALARPPHGHLAGGRPREFPKLRGNRVSASDLVRLAAVTPLA